MRTFLFALPLMLCSVAQAADPDTMCASVYLSESARNNGQGNSGFDEAATRAQDDHLAQNPGEDASRYALTVIDGAQTIRDGLAHGLISADAVVTTATRCKRRYDSAAR